MPDGFCHIFKKKIVVVFIVFIIFSIKIPFQQAQKLGSTAKID
jgi:hypothetical protein